MQAEPRRCPACRKGQLESAIRVRSFQPHGKQVRVKLLTSRCPLCGAEATTAAQHAENLKRLAARKGEYGDLLMGEEVLSLRKRYGITQQQAAKLFGKGKIAFSRYETETSYPDATMSKLLALALENPSVVRSLADKAGVALPLWQARCNEEREAKVHMIRSAKADAEAQRWSREAISSHLRSTELGAMLSLWERPPAHSLELETANDEHYEVPQEQYA